MTFKEYRKRKYRTAQEFADALEMPVCRVQAWESKTVAPRAKDIRKVAKALGISVNKLLECFEKRAEQ